MKNISRGFSLVELLVVAGILGFILSAVLLNFINSTALNEASRNLVTATAHAEFFLETVKNIPFASLSSSTAVVTSATITSNGLVPMNSEVITTTITGTNPLDVSVQVDWVDTRGRSRSKVLRTLMSV